MPGRLAGSAGFGPRAELLLRETSWLQQLVTRLSHEGHDADDLSQDVKVLALTRAPTEVLSVRAWLTAVTRRLAVRRQHRARLGERCERRAARPEAQPSAGEVVARVEAHRRVVEAVLALDEPYRTAVLLRFFEGRKPVAIAGALGCPVATVRTRIARGLQMLRARLERALGPREGWTAALGLVGLRPATVPGALVQGSTAGVIGMGIKKVCFAGLVLVLLVSLGSFVYWSTSESGDGGRSGAASAAALRPPAADLASKSAPAEVEVGPASRTEVVSTEPDEARVPDVGPLPVAGAGELVVLVLDQEGRRVVGARVWREVDEEPVTEVADLLTRRIANGGPIEGHLELVKAAFRNAAGASGQDGTGGALVFELQLGDGAQQTLHLADHASLGVAGRSVPTLGRMPLLSSWFVEVNRATASPRRLQEVGKTGRDGTCRVPAVGGLAVLATTARTSSGLVDVGTPAPGALVVLEVRAVCAVSGVVVDAAGQPLPAAEVEATPVALTFPRARPTKATTDAEGRFTLELDPFGWHDLEAHKGDAKAETLAVEATPGATASVRMRMLGAVTLTGEVRDPLGAVCGEATVHLARVDRDARADPRTKPFTAEATTQADGTFQVLLPGAGEYVAVARHGNWANGVATPVRVPLAGPPPRVRLDLTNAGAIYGAVRWQDGFPVVGAQVTARPLVPNGTPAPPNAFVGDTARVETDAAGAYRIDGLVPHVRYLLTCVADPTRPGGRAERPDVAPGPQDFAFERESLRGASLRLLIQTDGGPPPAAGSLVVSRRDGDAWRRGDLHDVEIKDGQVWIEGLERGVTYAVELRGTDYGRCRTSPFVAGAEGERLLRLTRPGVVTVSVRDAKGRPVLGARVVLREDAPAGLRRDDSERTTDAFGRAQWDSVSVLPWTVFAELDGRRSETMPLLPEAGRTVTVELQIAR